MPHRNRVLIVDDKTGDGEAIVRSLWKLQIPSFFFHHDPQNLEELDEAKKLEGIRLVFQDIALVSSHTPGHSDYAAAATAIKKILSDDNGPWLMVAWSTWADEPDKGDQYAKGLFDYLCKSLPKGQRPYHFIVIDKNHYTVETHGEVDELDGEKKRALLEAVANAIEPTKSLQALNQWEADVRNSASYVYSTLWNMTQGNNATERDLSLAGLLFQLAKAQEGKILNTSSDISDALYEILSNILYDRVSHMRAREIVVGDKLAENVQKEVINTMLHWEKDSSRRAPGAVYLWPGEKLIDLGDTQIKAKDLKEFIISAFVENNEKRRNAADKDRRLLDNVFFVIMDITPACDHANGKAIWRRFISGVFVSEYAESHFCKKGKLAGEFLKATDQFFVDTNKFREALFDQTLTNLKSLSFMGNSKGKALLQATKQFSIGVKGRFIFNSKLVFSLNEWIPETVLEEATQADSKKLSLEALTSVGRLREQCLRDIIFWYGAMATRPGIVSVY